MNTIGIALVWCVVQVTSIGLLAGGLYLVVRRLCPAAAASVVFAGLATVVVLSLLLLSPWPRWMMRNSPLPPAGNSGNELSAVGGRMGKRQGVRAARGDNSPSRSRGAQGVKAAALNDSPLPPAGYSDTAEQSAVGGRMGEGQGVRVADVDNSPLCFGETQGSSATGNDALSIKNQPSGATLLWQGFLDELTQPQATGPTGAWRWPGVVAVLLLVAMACGLGWLMLGIAAVRRQRLRSQPVLDAPLLELLEVLRGELGCHRHVEVRQSGDLATAVTIGWRRPMLLLSTDWTTWTVQQRRVVLSHEIAHAHSHDFLALLVGHVGLALHFYHPLLHWLIGRLRLEQELAADAAAASVSGGQRQYLATVAELALCQRDRALSWPTRSFFSTQTTLLTRIAMLRDSKLRFDRPSPVTRLTTVGVVLLCGLLAAGLRGPAGARQALAEDAEKPAALAEEGRTNNKTAAPKTENILSNPGAEKGDKDPDDWAQGAEIEGVKHVWDKKVAFEGKASLSIPKQSNYATGAAEVPGTTYTLTPLSGDNVQTQPAGSLDITNQAQLSAYGLSALTGGATTDPAKFQAILTYVGGLPASSPLRTLWIPTGIWYVNNASLTVNKGPLALVGQSKTGSVLRRPVISTGFMLPMLSSGGTGPNPAWASTASALGSAASGTVTAVSDNQVTVAGGNFADCVGRTVYNAHSLPISPPSTAPTLALSSSSHSVTNGTHDVAVTYVTQGGNPGFSDSETTIGKAASITVTNNDDIVVTVPVGPPCVMARNIYMTKAGTTTPYYCVTKGSITIDDNKTTTYTIHLSDATLAAAAWPPYRTNCAVLPNYACGKITAGGSGSFTAALSGGLLSNAWKVGDHYDVEVDSPPLTVENLTLDGNWPAQWFMVGTNANTVAGATVVDNSKTFTAQLGALAKNVTRDLGHTRITAVTPHSFTTAGAPGFPAVTWKPGEQYALDRGSEFANLLSLYAASSTPGRLTANVRNVNFINERDSRGICLENNVNLRASNLYGANIGSVICAVESFCNMQVTGLSDDGIGTAAATVGGIRVPAMAGDAPFYYEVDPDAEGYSRGKYNSRTYPYAGAPNHFTLSDIRLSNRDCLEQNPAGLYCVHHYNNLTATRTTGWIFFWDGDTNSTTIENSRFNSGFYNGNNQYAVQFEPGTELIENTAFLGLKNPNYGTGSDLYYIAAISECAGGKIPYSITFTNDTFDVDSSVSKGGFPGIAAMRCSWANNKTSGNTLNLKGGSVSGNVIDAVVNAQACNINGTTFDNTGYLWRQCFYPGNAARLPWTLNITNPSFGKGSGKYLGINSQGSLAYKLAVTQTDVVLPVAYSRMDIVTASGTWPSGITVQGRKTIIGPSTVAPTKVCAFGDDLLGAGSGDYYQDAAAGYIHRFRCTHTCWYDGSTFRINGGGGGSAWTQVQ